MLTNFYTHRHNYINWKQKNLVKKNEIYMTKNLYWPKDLKIVIKHKKKNKFFKQRMVDTGVS